MTISIDPEAGIGSLPHELTATETAARIRAGELSPVELVTAIFDRIRAVDEHVHAFTTTFETEALAEAGAAERRIAAEGARGPLDGVPVSVKDLIDVAGVRTSASSKTRAGHIATEDAELVGRLREAGAIVIGKTELHEFAMGTVTPNTRNPRCPDRVAGGSSGGSAAAVAAGMGALSVGTDTGGSVRIPASMCGTVGLKPTHGLVSTRGVFPLSWSLDAPGLLTRSVADAALGLGPLAGRPSYVDSLDESVRGLTIGVPSDEYFAAVDPEIGESVRIAVEELASAGAKLTTISLPYIGFCSPALALIMASESVNQHGPTLRAEGELYGSDARDRLEEGALVYARDYLDAIRARHLVHEAWRAAFDGIDAVALPTVPVQQAAPGEWLLHHPDGSVEIAAVAYTRFTHPGSFTGLPGLSVPCGRTTQGVPVGLQLMGRPHGEQILLRLGHAYETRTGGPWPVAEPLV